MEPNKTTTFHRRPQRRPWIKVSIRSVLTFLMGIVWIALHLTSRIVQLQDAVVVVRQQQADHLVDPHSLNPQQHSPRQSTPTRQNGFAACLMFKSDNDLLYEFIAYHYLIMPLRYIVVGTDVGNQQDPEIVLKRWKDFGLQYKIIPASDFHHFPEPRPKKDETEATKTHHQFMNRQKGFIRSCTSLLKDQSQWNTTHPIQFTMFVDSDEFVTWNTFSQDEPRAENDLDRTWIRNRQRLLPFYETHNSTWTVLDFLHRESDYWAPENRNNTICYTIPRLRFGALRNHSCTKKDTPTLDGLLAHPNTTTTTNKNQIPQLGHLSTIQYLQHAPKGHFASNKFGKVLVDLSRIPHETLMSLSPPRNIHRPWKDYCGYASKPHGHALLRINHYLADWERYSARKDARRSKAYWEETAYLHDGESCHDSTHRWLHRFVQNVTKGNVEQARHLLNIGD